MTRRPGLSLAMILPHGASGLQAQSTQTPAAALRTEYVMLVIPDEVRWPELYGGADASLIGRGAHVSDTAALRRDPRRSFRFRGAQ